MSEKRFTPATERREDRRGSNDESWRQQLMALRERLPAAKIIMESDADALLKHVKKIDDVVWKRHLDIRDTLAEYGWRPENLEITEVQPDVFRVSIRNTSLQNQLTEGYGYKGGAARVLLAQALGSPVQSGPRDFDIVRLPGFVTSPEQDAAIGLRLMGDDFSRSSSDSRSSLIENVDDEAYFNKHDFTINELYADREAVYATKQCLLDTVRRIVRPSHNKRVKNHFFGHQIRIELEPSLVAKAIRFWAESIHLYGESELQLDSDELMIEPSFMKPFYLLLQLDKAFQGNRAVVVKYVEECQRLGFLPKHITSPEDALQYVFHLLEDEAFSFRSTTGQQLAMEESWLIE